MYHLPFTFEFLFLCILNLCSLKLEGGASFIHSLLPLLNKDNSMVMNWRMKNDKLCAMTLFDIKMETPLLHQACMSDSFNAWDFFLTILSDPMWNSPHNPHRNIWRLVWVQLALLMRPSYTNTHLNSTVPLMSFCFFLSRFWIYSYLSEF